MADKATDGPSAPINAPVNTMSNGAYDHEGNGTNIYTMWYRKRKILNYSRTDSLYQSSNGSP